MYSSITLESNLRVSILDTTSIPFTSKQECRRNRKSRQIRVWRWAWFPEGEEDGVEKSHRRKRLGRKVVRESE